LGRGRTLTSGVALDPGSPMTAACLLPTSRSCPDVVLVQFDRLYFAPGGFVRIGIEGR